MKAIQAIKAFLLRYNVLMVFYAGITIFGFIQLLATNDINNFKIFRASSYHMLHGLPLYVGYPQEYFDLFFYNPTFPMFFLPFALLPVKAGLLAWMGATMLLCFVAFRKLPIGDEQKKVLIFLMLFDLLNNITHTQTNPVFLAFMLLVWVMMEKDKPLWAALFATLSFLIKGYGGIIGVLCLFYKGWYKVVLYSIGWFIVLNAMLLFFISPALLVHYYQDWLQIISSDTIKESFSVYGILKNLNIGLPEEYILIAAVTVLAAFLLMQIMVKRPRKDHIIAFLLIWVIVFNRAAESATYIIAIAGVIIWHLTRPRNTLSSILFWVTMTVATLFPTNISTIFDKLRYDYYLKSILCLLVLADILIYTAVQLRHRRENEAYL